MTIEMVLVVALAAEGAVVSAVIGAMFFSGWWKNRAARRAVGPLGDARRIVTRAAAGIAVDEDSLASLAKINRDQLTDLVFEVASLLSPEDRKILEPVLASSGMIDQAYRDLESRSWRKRLHGVRVLGVVSATSPLMPGLLKDESEHVRSASAQWVADTRSGQFAQQVAAMLDDPQTGCRFAAQNALIDLGPLASRPIQLILMADPRRSLVPALEVAVALGDRSFAGAASRFSSHTSPEVRILSARLLAAVGGSSEVKLLVSMLRDPSSEVRSAAARAIGNTQDWKAAGALVNNLSDPEWEPRYEAARALVSIGTGGLLLLRRASASDDEVVASIARQTLESESVTT